MALFFTPPHLAERAKELARTHPQLDGLVFATSGTTSEPKWVLHSQEGLDWCAETVNQHFECTSRDVWGLALPEFHVGGYGLVHRAKLANGQLERFSQKWNATAFHHWLTQFQVTITSLVPTQVFDLVSLRKKAPPSLRLALIGGEHLEETLFQKALELGWPLVTSYGMTETAGLIAASAIGQNDLTPLPGWLIGHNEEMLLTVTSPGLFKGYLTSEHLAATEQPFTTKDLVEIKDGHLRIKGRSDDQVKILGELVDLARLRKSLSATLSGHQATIISLPDQRRGHRLFPVIEGSSTNQISTQIADWNDSLPAFSRCEPPLFSPAWPRTPLGKIDRKTLTSQVTRERICLLPDS